MVKDLNLKIKWLVEPFKEFIPSVEKVLRVRFNRLFWLSNVDIKVTLTDGSFHQVDSSDVAFQVAAYAVKDAFEKAKPKFYNPLWQLMLKCLKITWVTLSES